MHFFTTLLNAELPRNLFWCIVCLFYCRTTPIIFFKTEQFENVFVIMSSREMVCLTSRTLLMIKLAFNSNWNTTVINPDGNSAEGDEFLCYTRLFLVTDTNWHVLNVLTKTHTIGETYIFSEMPQVFVMWFFVSVISSLAILLLTKRDGCFTLIMLWLSVFFVSSSRCCGLVCGISRSCLLF